jgi:hypothetical protein
LDGAWRSRAVVAAPLPVLAGWRDYEGGREAWAAEVEAERSARKAIEQAALAEEAATQPRKLMKPCQRMKKKNERKRPLNKRLSIMTKQLLLWLWTANMLMTMKMSNAEVAPQGERRKRDPRRQDGPH